MEIAEIKEGLFQASAYVEQDFAQLIAMKINSIIDLEGGFDPQFPGLKSYLYWPIKDVPWLPDIKQLKSVAAYGILMWRNCQQRLLVHCAKGYNRSGLVNGMILNLDGMPGSDAAKLIREKRPGALFNPVFSHYLETLK